MSIKCQDIISELEERELIAQLAGEDKLREHLAEDSRSVYCGFETTYQQVQSHESDPH